MPALTRLVKVGSMVDSLGAYVPAKILAKALGMVRLMVFLYLLSKVQFTLWGLGGLVMAVAAPILTLGANHALVRYAGLYEERNQLASFYKRIRWPLFWLCLVLTGAAMAFSGPLTRLVMVAKADAGGVDFQQLWPVCMAGLANGFALALYHNLLSIIIGIRAYRLVAVLELSFSVIFAGFGVVAICIQPTALAVLSAHMATLVLATIAAGAGLKLYLKNPPHAQLPTDKSIADETDSVEAITDPGAVAAIANIGAPVPDHVEPIGHRDYFRLLRFGLLALPGFVIWQWANNTSFFLTSKIRGLSEGGEFLAFMLLGQPVVFLADSAWAVVFTHVAKRWEAGDRNTAMFTLKTAYKAIAMVMMSLSIILLALSPLWVKILPRQYQHGLVLLPGLFMFFQVIVNLALLTIVAKLHERPWVIALAGVFGIACNIVLGMLWIPKFNYAPQGAALAGGIGMYVGSVLTAVIYFALARVKIGPAALAILLAPALLLLPVWAGGAIWVLALLTAAITPLVFSSREKQILLASLARLAQMIRRVVSWA